MLVCVGHRLAGPQVKRATTFFWCQSVVTASPGYSPPTVWDREWDVRTMDSRHGGLAGTLPAMWTAF